jgi:hypothetical protein
MNRLAAQRRMWLLKKAKEQELQEELKELSKVEKKKKSIWLIAEQKEREENT